MKQYVIGALLILAVTKTGFAQKTASLKATDLSINLEMLGRNDDKIRSVLSIKNNGKAELPASGWKIYFNSRVVKTWAKDSTIATIKHVNGDLFCLSPLKAFKKIPGGAEIRLQLALESMNNVTERPQGFYLVWDKSPDLGENITRLTYKPFPGHLKEEQELAAKVYQRNTEIKDIPEGDLPTVFPTPSAYLKQEGFFKLNSAVQLVTGGVFENEARGFSDELAKILGKKPAVLKASANGGIFFEQESSMAKEAYELQISPQKIVIKAADAAGAFYGIQSLKTMFPPKAWASVQTSVNLPAATVKDAPRFGFRGFMMDVGRNFQPKSEVFKVLDLMALYKLNVFHFHLTEDEGWRLEIPGLPELTSVGAQRGHSLE